MSEEKTNKAPLKVEQKQQEIDPAFQRVLDAKKEFIFSVSTSHAKLMAAIAPETQEQAVAEREFIEHTVKDFQNALVQRLNTIMVPTYFNVSVASTEGVPKDSVIVLVNDQNIKPKDDGKPEGKD